MYVLQLRGGLIEEIKVPVHERTWRSNKEGEGVYVVVALNILSTHLDHQLYTIINILYIVYHL